MATLLTPEPPKKTPATLMSVLAMIPALIGSYGAYKASTRDTDTGYRALVTTTLQLQQEVMELHSKVDALETEKVTQKAVADRLTKMADELQVAHEDITEDAGVEPTPVQHHFEAKPPPATLQEAVDAKEKL